MRSSTFLIVAFVLFVVLKVFNALHKKPAPAALLPSSALLSVYHLHQGGALPALYLQAGGLAGSSRLRQGSFSKPKAAPLHSAAGAAFTFSRGDRGLYLVLLDPLAHLLGNGLNAAPPQRARGDQRSGTARCSWRSLPGAPGADSAAMRRRGPGWFSRKNCSAAMVDRQ